MKQISTSKGKNSRVEWVFLGAAFVTIYFNAKIQDPFNSPKLWLLLALASVCLGGVVTSYRQISSNLVLKRFFYLNIFFLISLLNSAIFTTDSFKAFFGESQRRTGFLTYFALSILTIFIIFRINLSKTFNLIKFMAILGFGLSLYGLLQNSGNDFVDWNNPYNSVILTVGNPNYAAALLAIFGVSSLGILIIDSASAILKILSALNSILIFYTIYLSNARQGIISFLVGSAVITVYYAFSRKKIAGFLLLFSTLIVFVIAILGMLQIGPLTELLYKSSVSIRGFYWQAGLKMFFSDPLTGIGIDSYGDYFKEFRESQYPLNYGFDLTSTNAHNVPIQFFATGGFFVGISYILINIFILHSAYGAIKLASRKNRPFIVTILASWLSFQAQAFISIDNIGLTIWGWILGATLVGIKSFILSGGQVIQKNYAQNKSIGNKELLSFFTSFIAIVLTTAISVNQLKGEENAFFIRSNYQESQKSQSQIFYQKLSDTFNIKFNDPYYRTLSGYYMVISGLKDEGMLRLEKSYADNPRNLDTLNLLAGLSEELGLTSDAIKYRQSIAKFDPWNAKNYLRLGNLYKFIGDKEKMDKTRNKILSFASQTDEGKAASIELFLEN
jgi:tetratricopeptide (TPR) repeat protein